ncbi:hypothetical protein BKA62DRAFT_650669 [Auriculariales sp. MPI-PUGE-AT-0066]|nr:hypothetical protein BKA62DRAFT_650669 [Auriculariales sp. MPI-PUGE-AT-0066]
MEGGSRDADTTAKSPQKNYVVGLGLLSIVVLLWTSSNYLIQNLLEGGYDKPFLLTYLSTSTFSCYLVPFALREHRSVASWWRRIRRRTGHNDAQYTSLSTSNVAPHHPPQGENAPLTTRETAVLALKFAVLWLLANWTSNASLAYTSVASTTILTTTSGFFTLGVGALFKVEKFTLLKVCAVVASFCGVVLVALSDSRSQQTDDVLHGESAVFGDALALLSALGYALYVVLLKVGIGSEERIDMQQFFGFIGIFTLTLFWPFGLFLHAIGMEHLALPQTTAEIISVVINCVITFVSDYLFLLAMLKTTPLLTTIGLSTTIPVALLGDLFLGRPTAAQALFGGSFVLLGFVVVGWDDARTTRREQTPLLQAPSALRTNSHV